MLAGWLALLSCHVVHHGLAPRLATIPYAMSATNSAGSRDTPVTAREAAVAQREAAVAQREAAVYQRESAIEEREVAVALREASASQRETTLTIGSSYESSKQAVRTVPHTSQLPPPRRQPHEVQHQPAYEDDVDAYKAQLEVDAFKANLEDTMVPSISPTFLPRHSSKRRCLFSRDQRRVTGKTVMDGGGSWSAATVPLDERDATFRLVLARRDGTYHDASVGVLRSIADRNREVGLQQGGVALFASGIFYVDGRPLRDGFPRFFTGTRVTLEWRAAIQTLTFNLDGVNVLERKSDFSGWHVAVGGNSEGVTWEIVD